MLVNSENDYFNWKLCILMFRYNTEIALNNAPHSWSLLSIGFLLECNIQIQNYKHRSLSLDLHEFPFETIRLCK